MAKHRRKGGGRKRKSGARYPNGELKVSLPEVVEDPGIDPGRLAELRRLAAKYGTNQHDPEINLAVGRWFRSGQIEERERNAARSYEALYRQAQKAYCVPKTVASGFSTKLEGTSEEDYDHVWASKVMQAWVAVDAVVLSAGLANRYVRSDFERAVLENDLTIVCTPDLRDLLGELADHFFGGRKNAA